MCGAPGPIRTSPTSMTLSPSMRRYTTGALSRSVQPSLAGDVAILRHIRVIRNVGGPLFRARSNLAPIDSDRCAPSSHFAPCSRSRRPSLPRRRPPTLRAVAPSPSSEAGSLQPSHHPRASDTSTTAASSSPRCARNTSSLPSGRWRSRARSTLSRSPSFPTRPRTTRCRSPSPMGRSSTSRT
jgi:hypothetical protein